MKIAYLVEWDFSNVTGVSKKILSQLELWNQLGAQAELFVVTTNPPLETYQTLAHFFNSKRSASLKGSLQTYVNKILCANKLREALISYKPDLIYYRLGIWYPGLEDILNLAPSVFELNSLEVNELENANLIKQKLYPWGRKRLLQQATAFTPVSNEIAQDISDAQKPTFVCGNGFDFSQVQKTELARSQSRPQMLFVGTDGQAWHGTDLIIKLAEMLPDLDFHLVGISKQNLSLKNIFFHGPLFNKELSTLASNMDVGIGTLALFRNKMNEASPLKTREYGAWGLPFIYAYQDTDLPDNLNFVLELPNDESKILASAEKIRIFAHQWLNQPHDNQRFHPYFDRKSKEQKRLRFFSEILQKKEVL